MEQYMMENLKRTKNMDTAFSDGLTEEYMMDNLKMKNLTGMALSHTLRE